MRFPGFGSSRSSSQEQWYYYDMIQLVLRFLVSSLSICSILILVTSGETVTILGVGFEAHYYFSSSYKFFLAACAVVATTTIFTVIYICTQSVMDAKNHFFLHIHDLIATLLMVAGCSAATAVGLIGKYGEKKLYWNPFCSMMSKFCSKIEVSVVLAYLVFIVLFAVTIMTSFRVLRSIKAAPDS